jgi:hypothetical protein
LTTAIIEDKVNVRELIAELEKIQDKELQVMWRDRYGMGGDCCSNEEYHYHYDYGEPELENVEEVVTDSIWVHNCNTKGKMLKTKHLQDVIVVG